MPLTLEQIVEETSQWSADGRSELVECILLAGHGGITPTIAAAWKTETRLRLNEIQNGKAKRIPLDEVLAEARQLANP